MTVTRRDRWSAVGLAVVALGYLLAGRRYSLDTLATPGPGIFPLAVGLALLALAAWQFATAGRGAALATADPPPPPTATDTPAASGATRSRPPLILAAGLVMYAAALPVIGFLPASSVLVVGAARLMGLPGWWRPAALALGVIAASHVVFVTWLGVPLP
jgi:putative tricarboxylic transport membrane protein